MRRSTRSAAPARSAWWCEPRWTRSAATVPRCSRGPEPTSPRAGRFGGPSRGPENIARDRGPPRLRRGGSSAGGFGGPSRGPEPSRVIETRHGSAEAGRAFGGFGGPSRGPPFNQSIENDPAVHVERLPGDVARAGGGEEDVERGDVLGIVGASEGNTGVA